MTIIGIVMFENIKQHSLQHELKQHELLQYFILGDLLKDSENISDC